MCAQRTLRNDVLARETAMELRHRSSSKQTFWSRMLPLATLEAHEQCGSARSQSMQTEDEIGWSHGWVILSDVSTTGTKWRSAVKPMAPKSQHHSTLGQLRESVEPRSALSQNSRKNQVQNSQRD